jgi:hypothetical protein
VEIKPNGNIKILGFQKEVMNEKECLIIDESSMMDDEIYTKVKEV